LNPLHSISVQSQEKGEAAMEAEVAVSLGKIGAAIGVALAAVGSALGTGAAGMAAVGAWKKCYAQNKAAPFLLAVFVGAPITQTFYGLLAMFKINGAADAIAGGKGSWPGLIGWGVFAGLAMGMSAWMQGKTGAAASDAFAESGQGFANYLMALGVIESVALFMMIFVLIGV
jgi:V/A-type H+-transporting ATPase subunit K